MSTLNRNMKLSIGCPNCKEVFKETATRLREMSPTLICPTCGPFQVEADELQRILQQVERVLLEAERICASRKSHLRRMPLKSATCGREPEPGLRRRSGSNNVTLTGNRSMEFSVRTVPPRFLSREVFVRNPLLSIRLISLAIAVTLIPVALKSQDSVADVARKNRSKDQTVTKRVWTNDDVASASSTEPNTPQKETRESESATVEWFRMLDRHELGVGVLRRAGAPDVDFPKRRDWEQSLLEAENAWSDQVDRMVAHKESSKASQEEELRLAVGKQRIFERIEAEGIEKAKAEADPVLKAHLIPGRVGESRQPTRWLRQLDMGRFPQPQGSPQYPSNAQPVRL